ncbi:hypothetical protein ACFJZM_13360 [Enterococcus faecalis]|nr:hypothetical protein [Enterococcus faecalis]EGO8584609.1 hypothetical protein [Enterococcus faecalis]ELS1303486.1 hypothetical protein [Enterococcus faecalis]NSU60190.1 hypothetical protein [Enterococcus faecalis]NSU78341.1 hypothetical protein [Enterococcus faecalis]
MKITIILGVKDTSGGGESLHQLCAQLQKKYDCGIFYYDSIDYKCPDKFKKYNIQVLEKIRDDNDSIVIVPDIYTGYLANIKFSQKIIWWLSYDFYEMSLPKNKAKKFLEKYKLPNAFSGLVLFLAKMFKVIPIFMFNEINFKKDSEIEHIYNCEYLKAKLKRIGIKEEKMSYLCAPISDTFYKSNNTKKQNLVAYNPSKGKQFTDKLIKACNNYYPNIDFVPIIDMTEKEVYNCLSSCKLYIDFGEFPGPERIPRQAVMCRCNIITSLEGAAENQYDVPIPNDFKIERKESNIVKICNKINKSLINYEKELYKFNLYRKKVLAQKNNFSSDILSIFDKIGGK